jgi:hypothetical protein
MNQIENPSKGIALILAFFSFTGMLGIDKFYTGNYIIGSIQSILTLSLITIPITVIINLLTIILLLIVIFSNYNFLYVEWTETTQFDYTIGFVVLTYFILKYIKISTLYYKDNLQYEHEEKN